MHDKFLSASWLKSLQCERGATVIEYGLFLAGFSFALVAIVFNFGDQLNTAMVTLADAIDAGIAANI